MTQFAMFEGLVSDEEGRTVTTAMVGANAFYVVWDDDFARHIDAESVDVQVLRFLRGEVEGQRDEAVSAMLQMLGKDDLFTKAAVEASINNMESAVGNPIPMEARQMLGMMGFKIIVDFHGNVTDISMPAGAMGDE